MSRSGALGVWGLLLTSMLALVGCRPRQACLPIYEERSGEPQRYYDEFTQVTSLESEFHFTPDQEWELREYRRDQHITWNVDMWLRGASSTPLVEVTLRPMCSGLSETDEEDDRCINCDTVCDDNNGRLEVIADGRPIPLPRGSYRRLQVGAPTEDSPATWASTLSLRVTPEALWPIAHANQVKLRVCGTIVITLRREDLANVQQFLRHHQAIAPRKPGFQPRPSG